MSKEEFIELSKKEVRQLNAGYNNLNQHSESWRAGYEFAREYVLKLYEEKYHDEFLEEIEKFSTQELEVFEFNIDN